MYEEKPIKFALGISTGGIITGVQIIDHKETAGLGDLIEDESFLNSFIGFSVTIPFFNLSNKTLKNIPP